MPRVCKKPQNLKAGETLETPDKCLKKGIGIGKNLRVKIELSMPKDVLREIAKQQKVTRYSYMSKQQLYDAILASGIDTFKPFDLMS